MLSRHEFKMCTECGVFIPDFSDMFCSTCGKKLEYVDVSSVDTLKMWLLSLEENDYDADSEFGSDDSGDFDEIDQKFEDEHVCYIGEDCSNSECIDCVDNFGDSGDSGNSGSD